VLSNLLRATASASWGKTFSIPCRKRQLVADNLPLAIQGRLARYESQPSIATACTAFWVGVADTSFVISDSGDFLEMLR